MTNVPKVTVNITENIHNLLSKYPDLTWDSVVEGIKACVARDTMHVVRDILVTPEGFVYSIEDVVGQVETVSISATDVEVTVHGRVGPRSGYFNAMLVRGMIEPKMFRLSKFGLRTALVFCGERL